MDPVALQEHVSVQLASLEWVVMNVHKVIQAIQVVLPVMLAPVLDTELVILRVVFAILALLVLVAHNVLVDTMVIQLAPLSVLLKQHAMATEVAMVKDHVLVHLIGLELIVKLPLLVVQQLLATITERAMLLEAVSVLLALAAISAVLVRNITTAIQHALLCAIQTLATVTEAVLTLALVNVQLASLEPIAINVALPDTTIPHANSVNLILHVTVTEIAPVLPLVSVMKDIRALNVLL
jgi:hypothetical protein